MVSDERAGQGVGTHDASSPGLHPEVERRQVQPLDAWVWSAEQVVCEAEPDQQVHWGERGEAWTWVEVVQSLYWKLHFGALEYWISVWLDSERPYSLKNNNK